MKYILEIYYQGKSIEIREQYEPFPSYLPGDYLYVEFGNPNYSEEYGKWWIIRKRRFILFNPSLETQAVQLYCEPDPDKGKI